MASELNSLISRFGGCAVEPLLSKSSLLLNKSLEIPNILSLAMEMAAFTLRWAADLKQTANTVASLVYSLPVEILKMILQAAMDATEPYFYYRTLHRLRFVSMRWNQTILNTPSLWTTITARMPAEFIELAAQRSQDMPLAFDFNPHDARPGTPVYKIVDQMITHQDRCASLSVRTWGSDLDHADRFLEAGVASLKSFTLSSAGPKSGLDLNEWLRVFMAGAPWLQDITISHWNFRWSTVTPRWIKSLTLLNNPSRTQGLGDLMRMLSCCFQLERLRIEEVKFPIPPNDTPAETQRAIYLSALKELSIDIDSVASTTFLLDTLVIPPETRVVMNNRMENQVLLSDAFGRWMTEASIGWACPNSITFKEDGRGCLSITYGDGHFQIINIMAKMDGIRKLLSLIHAERRTATTSVEFLHWYRVSTSSDNWVTLLAKLFPAATSFKFDDEAEKILVELSTATPTLGSSKRSWPFPSLEHLRISGAVTATTLLRFASARKVGADDGEIARLVDITAVNLEGTDEERRNLERLVTILRR